MNGVKNQLQTPLKTTTNCYSRLPHINQALPCLYTTFENIAMYAITLII